MRTVLIAAAFAAFSISTAYAGDIMASRYGNTTISKDASGNESHLYYAADGTFTGKQGATSFRGSWKISGATIDASGKCHLCHLAKREKGDIWGHLGTFCPLRRSSL